VREDERRFILDVEIATERESADAFDVVAEDRNRREVVANRQFPAMKDRAARHAELPSTILAAPDLPRTIAIHLDVSAMRAVGLPVVV
jgi:hypothetical protein